MKVSLINGIGVFLLLSCLYSTYFLHGLVNRNDRKTSVQVNTALPKTNVEFNSTELHPLDRIKVPLPIFVASLPKSGTTSTARYFYCGDIWTAHTFVNTIGSTHKQKQMRVGHCFLNNLQANRSMLTDCGHYNVWSDAGHARGTPCFYPSVHGLDAWYDENPTSTILLVTRNSTAWANSLMRWKHGELTRKWERCDKFPTKNANETDLIRFYEWHKQNIRDFAAAHPSLKYIELSIEDEEIGQKLEDSIGVPSSCFRHHNSHEKRMRLNPKFRRQFEEGLKKKQGR